ncbi:NRDE2-like protein [Colletotrichum higginsianum]|uniref:NRDE2-like protein n=1 Tax=Colletotrichum higginsianum TaxID=80884 RepID=A0A4T0W9Z0_9PEZI|nr:NRDE2-like protein [Colletotrichum higginsianum]
MSDTGGKRLTVPKFSSFKPKASTSTPLDTKTSHDRKDEKDDKFKERRSRHLSNVLSVAEGVFFFDKKGDPLIRRYGGNDRSRVPMYRRGYRGRVLGSDGYLFIHGDGSYEQFSIRMPGEGSFSSRDRALFQPKVHRAKPKRIRLRNEPSGNLSHGVEEDFVPLSNLRRRHIEESQSSGDERPSYRSIEGKAKAHEFSDSDIDLDSDAQEDTGLDMDDPLKQRSIQLARKIKEHPENIEAWLELIRHQDVLLNAGQSLDREVTKAEVHSFAEIKTSMFESALAQAKKPEDEERLLLGLMLEGSKVWSTSKLDNRWEDVAKKHDSSFCLWKARVDNKLTSLSTFQYTDIKAMHINRLQAILKQDKVSGSPFPGHATNDSEVSRYEQMIFVFLRATRFTYAAGFREMAVAAWQALLDLNLQRPSNCDDVAKLQVLDSFRDFWEDEAPRIGEKGASGWRHYVQVNGTVDLPESQKDDSAIQGSRDVYRSWGATERLRATNARSPARATDDVLEDDPYRVVMFSDIEEFLFVIPSSAVPTVWKQLVDAFLLFCCLPPAFRASAWTEAAENDALITGSWSLFENDVLQKPNEPDVMDESKKTPTFKQDGSRLVASPDLLFAGPDWFSLFSGWTSTSKVLDGPVNLTLVTNAVRLLVSSKEFGELAEYSLSIEAVNEPNSIKKRAKALIKQDPANLKLYNAYALAEFVHGKSEVGFQVVASATGLISTPNNIRDILRKVALTNENDCISNRIFAIRYELQRGNVHSTQAAFEKALDSPACRSNPGLWRCYIRFSYARKQFRNKAKDVFLRGLRHCPWSKELALEAYTTLVNVMDEFELKSVFDTMLSKGLRIHVDMDDFIANHEKARADVSEASRTKRNRTGG